MQPLMFRRSSYSVLAIAVMACALAPASATAGTVQVRSCADAPFGGSDTAWQIVDEGLGGYEAPTAVCPPIGDTVGSDPDHDQIPGRSIWTKLSSGVAVVTGATGELRFSAPSGTTIDAVRIRRDIGKRSDGYRLYGATDAGVALEPSCAIPSGYFTCGIGGYEAGYATFAGLAAHWVAWGFACGDLGYATCSTGSTLHEAWAHLYGAVVTLTDNQPPTGVTSTGTVTTAGWKRGAVDGAISGSDNLGVQKLRWYADGALVSTSADRSCDFSVTVPCPDASGESYALNTAAIADGSHSVQAAVVDPAGNETKGAAFAVQVDNTAPPTPTGLTLSGGGPASEFSARWTAPAADGGSSYVGSAWEACAGGSCTSGSGGLTSASGTLPPGTSTVKVWLIDAAGNGSPVNAASSTITSLPLPAGGGGGGGGGGAGGGSGSGGGGGGSAAPATATATSTPTTTAAPTTVPAAPATRARAALRLTGGTLDARTGRLTLRGVAHAGASGRVAITLTTRGHRTTLHATIRHGHYRLRTRLARDTRRVRVTVRYPGSADVRPGRVTRMITSI
jgi:hypothetical protein